MSIFRIAFLCGHHLFSKIVWHVIASSHCEILHAGATRFLAATALMWAGLTLFLLRLCCATTLGFFDEFINSAHGVKLVVLVNVALAVIDS